MTEIKCDATLRLNFINRIKTSAALLFTGHVRLLNLTIDLDDDAVSDLKAAPTIRRET